MTPDQQEPPLSGDLSLHRARTEANLGHWENSLQTLLAGYRVAPGHRELREFLSEALVHQGQREKALELLRQSPRRTACEDFRRSWLSEPAQRSRPLQKVSPVLHSLYGTEPLQELTIQPFGPIPKGLLQDLLAFHNREFPSHRLNILEPSPHQVKESFETLRDLMDVGSEPSWLPDHGVALVLAKSQTATAYSSGLGTSRMVLLKLMPDDPFQSTVAAHELYHCLLDLNHTNGVEGPSDEGSVMGPWGLRAPLTATYVSEFQRRCCTTTPEVQALVDREHWEEALERDPHYLALYKRAADRRLRSEEPQKALFHLQNWFEIDPGPEAASDLGELLLHLKESPNSVFSACRGYGQVANTHLYLAQACLKAHAYPLALEQLQRALAFEPENLHAIGMTGAAYQGLGDRVSATSHYRQALDRCPGWEAVKGRLAWLSGREFVASRDDDDLLWIQSQTSPKDEGIELLSRSSDQRALHRRGWLLQQEGHTHAAKECFVASRALHPYSLEGRASEAWIAFLESQRDYRALAQSVLDRWALEPTCRQLVQG